MKFRQTPSQSELRQLTEYDDKTGIFTWKTGLKKGKKAGSLELKEGYIKITIDYFPYRAHRLAWVYMNGDIDSDIQIDHINGDRSDNRISNLRLVTNNENLKNQRIRKSNTTGFNGVYFRKSLRRYIAKIQVNGKPIHLGSFLNLDDAINCRKAANIKYGFHENHGSVLSASKNGEKP